MATLILLPGMDGTGDLFAPFRDALPADLPLQVVSFPTQERLGYAALAARAFDLLPPEGDVFLLGESFSGPLAVMLAARLGARLRGLVLCCTFVRRPGTLLGILRPFAGLVPFEALPEWPAARLLLGAGASPALRGLLRNALAKVAPAVLRHRLQAVGAVDVAALLASCRSPVLCLRAAGDALVPASSCQHIVALRPDARVVVLQGPHCLLQVNPHEAAAAVMRFMRDNLRAI